MLKQRMGWWPWALGLLIAPLCGCGAGVFDPAGMETRVVIESRRGFAACVGEDCEELVCVLREFRECELDLDTISPTIDRDHDDQSGVSGNGFDFPVLTPQEVCMRVTARPSSPTARAEIGGSFTVERVCRPFG